MVGEGQVGQVIVPDRVVETERAVALAPGVAGALILLNDDRRDTEPSHACTKGNTTLATTDDQHIRLGSVPELSLLTLLALKPVHAILVRSMLHTLGSRRTMRLLMALQLLHAGE